MARVKTFVNGGSLLPSDLDTVEDDYEVAFGVYKDLATLAVRLDAPAAGTYLFVPGYTGSGLAAAGATAALGALWLDPARYWSVASTSSANPRTVYYNLGVAAVTNNTAVGVVSFTTGLYPVTGAAGTGAAQTGVAIGGSAVTGSTVTIGSPAVSSLIPGAWSGDFAAPAAGAFAVVVVVTANTAASSSIALRATLQVRQV